jgi:restriction system protein
LASRSDFTEAHASDCVHLEAAASGEWDQAGCTCQEADWKQQLLEHLLAMAPDAFERLAGRLLSEAGFDNVVVTGKTNDGGIFITTGTFTAEVTKEATREGVPLIDLIGGDLLCDELKRYGLGVQSEQVERVRVNGSFFSGI